MLLHLPDQWPFSASGRPNDIAERRSDNLSFRRFCSCCRSLLLGLLLSCRRPVSWCLGHFRRGSLFCGALLPLACGDIGWCSRSCGRIPGRSGACCSNLYRRASANGIAAKGYNPGGQNLRFPSLRAFRTFMERYDFPAAAAFENDMIRIDSRDRISLIHVAYAFGFRPTILISGRIL